MKDLIVALLLIVGAAFLLLAAIGVIRMPDVFSRMSATTKAATLGVSCLLLAAALHFDQLGVTTRALAAIAFFFLTMPVAAHVIGRAAYLVGVPLWEGTIADDLRRHYETNPDSSGASPPRPAGDRVFEREPPGSPTR